MIITSIPSLEKMALLSFFTAFFGSIGESYEVEHGPGLLSSLNYRDGYRVSAC